VLFRSRIAVMNRGVVEQVEGPEAVYERPRTTFVAGFIGVSNLMPGEVLSRNGAGAEVRLDSGMRVRAMEAHGLAAGDRCHAVVRPEKLELLPVGADSAGPSLEGTVESSLYLGAATQFNVALDGDMKLTALVPNSDDAARRRLPAAGERVQLAWVDEHMHLVREPEAKAVGAVQERIESDRAGAPAVKEEALK
jgi:spermidine/putrescine transport system ATP-binding protein